MCGIFGAVGLGNNLEESLHSITHRGPDDFGTFYDPDSVVFLGHRRLSILDLSKAGRQPMKSNSTNAVITYNGEVYNFQDLRREHLDKFSFSSHTDTEVILNLYEKYGINTPRYLRGMFAFAIFDPNTQNLLLSRDRVGIKPLYYYSKDNIFVFSSELSSFKSIESLDMQVDPIALDYYFTYGYIPAPLSIYKHIRKLKPAHTLTYDLQKRAIEINEPYWELKDNISTNKNYSEQDWIRLIKDKLSESIKIRLISDVPLGAFLSGGIDSSLIVSLMSNLVEEPIKTFTMGFDFQAYDERKYADIIASKYETKHRAEVVSPDAIQILPDLVASFGEPFMDPSAIPTYYVSKIARESVTVALSGDGGDEVFAGYSRYKRMYNLRYLSGIPIQMRKLIKYLGSHLPEHLPGYGFLQRQAYDNVELYREMNANLSRGERNEIYSSDFKSGLSSSNDNYYNQLLATNGLNTDSLMTNLQIIDLNSYLPEDILTKVDRMSMLHSLETRVPLLDHELIELAFSVPSTITFKNNNLKYILKELIRPNVSPDFLTRKKQGFDVPLDAWFRTDLKDMFLDNMQKFKSDPILNTTMVKKLFDSHLKGGRNFGRKLYAILFYYLWNENKYHI